MYKIGPNGGLISNISIHKKCSPVNISRVCWLTGEKSSTTKSKSSTQTRIASAAANRIYNKTRTCNGTRNGNVNIQLNLHSWPKVEQGQNRGMGEAGETSWLWPTFQGSMSLGDELSYTCSEWGEHSLVWCDICSSYQIAHTLGPVSGAPWLAETETNCHNQCHRIAQMHTILLPCTLNMKEDTRSLRLAFKDSQLLPASLSVSEGRSALASVVWTCWTRLSR